MPPKPKTVQPKKPDTVQDRDNFQTPNYATDILVNGKYIGGQGTTLFRDEYDIWEPMCGVLRKMETRLRSHGFEVIGTDLVYGEQYNVFTYRPEFKWRMAVSNLAFSIKYDVADLFCDYGNPFAFLIPADFSAQLIRFISVRNCQLIVPDRRISYITPNMCDVIFNNTTLKRVNKEMKLAGLPKFKKFKEIPQDLIDQYPGVRYSRIEDVPVNVIYQNSQAQFHSMYLTRGLNLPERLNFYHLSLDEVKNNI
jgi:hypothetical protein